MLKVGSKFDTFDELSQRLEEFQKVERVQLWVRDSRTVIAAAKRARRKSLNPALKYAELTYSCVFGGRRPSDQTKVHNQTSAGGCPFKVRLSTSGDGQALVVKEICHNHNHEPGKKLHDEPRRLYKKTHHSRAAAQDAQESSGGGGAATTHYSIHQNNSVTPNHINGHHNKPIKLIVSKQRLNSAGQPFANLQHHFQHQQQQQQQHQQQHLKLQLHNSTPHQHNNNGQHQQQQQPCFIKREATDQLTEFELGRDCIGTPDHLYNLDHAYPYNTPSNSSSNTTPSSLSNSPNSSVPNTPNISPNTSPSNSLSSGPEEPVLNFNLPPSPISPSSSSSNSCPLPDAVASDSRHQPNNQQQDEEQQRLEPLYDLSEALEDGLASLPSVNHSDPPPLLLPSALSQSSPLVPNSINNSSSSKAVKLVVSSSSDPHHHHNTVTTQLPRVRALTAPHNSNISSSSSSSSTTTSNTCTTAATTPIRVAYPAGNTVYRNRTIATPNGNIILGAESGALKSSSANNVQYNLVTNKAGGCHANSSAKSGCHGRITIQHYQTSNTNNTATTIRHNGGVSSGTAPLIVGINGAINNSTSCNSAHEANAAVAASPCTASVGTGGAVRNYRAKIAKKPYGVGVLKVVRSDNITRPIETFDRLINTVTPNKGYPLMSANLATTTSGATATSYTGLNSTAVIKRPATLQSSGVSDSTYSDNNLSNLYSNLFNTDEFKSLDLGDEIDKVMNSSNSPLLDSTTEISTAHIKTEPLDDPDPITTAVSSITSGGRKACIDGVIGGNTRDEPEDVDPDKDMLFVLDGLDTSISGDIPLQPEFTFNVADIDDYDFFMF